MTPEDDAMTKEFIDDNLAKGYPTFQISNGHSLLFRQQERDIQETTMPRLPLSEQLDEYKRLPPSTYI